MYAKAREEPQRLHVSPKSQLCLFVTTSAGGSMGDRFSFDVSMPAASITPTPLRVASLPRRFGAILYDSLLVIALWMLGTYVAVAIANQVLRGPLYQGALALTAYAFFAYFWTRHRRTLGMQAWQIEVMNEDGSPINLRQATIRFLIAIPALGFAAVGYWMQPFRRDKCTLGDLLSNSQVYYRPRN